MPNTKNYRSSSTAHHRGTPNQNGLTLVELMVGIAIGLLVVAVAMGALMASRGISGTVSDATSLQQQASYAFRVIGLQIKQAGSLELSLNPTIAGASVDDTNAAMEPVAFDPPDPTGVRPSFDRSASTIAGSDSPVDFTVGYQNYTEITTGSATVPASLLRDCLGQNSGAAVLSSKFELDSTAHELKCTGATAAGAQAIIGNVTDFKIRYAVQAPGTTTMQYEDSAAAISNWGNVYAVEVCLELTGSENTPTASGTYKNCSGTDTSYGDRLKMVFHNTYQIRSQSQV